MAEEWKSWEIPTVKTVKVDSKRRFILPAAKPGQVFAYKYNETATINRANGWV